MSTSPPPISEARPIEFWPSIYVANGTHGPLAVYVGQPDKEYESKTKCNVGERSIAVFYGTAKHFKEKGGYAPVIQDGRVKLTISAGNSEDLWTRFFDLERYKPGDSIAVEVCEEPAIENFGDINIGRGTIVRTIKANAAEHWAQDFSDRLFEASRSKNAGFTPIGV